MSDPIRIFIGTSANGEDAKIETAYEYSIRKNASREVKITWMKQTRKESSIWGGWDTQRWSTPFSGFRWAIPEACGFEGRAIYTDCDMINITDFAHLFDMDMEGKPFAARRGQRFGGHEFCVMLIDCERAADILTPVSRMKKNPDSHHRNINKFSGREEYVLDLDPKWNCLDGENYTLDSIFQLHYTKMSTQPWKPAWFEGTPEEHPRKDVVDLFWNTLKEAEENGYDHTQRIPEEKFGEYNIIGQ